MDPKDQKEIDNRANQLNPNNEEYHQSRGETQPTDRDDDDDDLSSNSNVDDHERDNDDADDFTEEWVPQDAW